MRFQFPRGLLQLLAITLIAFVILAVRFSPNWVATYSGIREALVENSDPTQRGAVEKAILSSYAGERGFYVLQQAHDPGVVIAEPNHKIIRWRLLVPVLGHILRLPGWFILGLGPIGCVGLIFALVATGSSGSAQAAHPSAELLCLALIAGASAPFITSMGWLGYYDSWLAVALLGVAFGRGRFLVLLSCILAPWIDERFVLGLPLALVVRRFTSRETNETNFSEWEWIRSQALVPLILVLGFVVVRLKLGGSSGSLTVTEYVRQFVFGRRITAAQRLFGAWEGLRAGWALVGIAVIAGLAVKAPVKTRARGTLLAAGVPAMIVLGLWSALDLSRSMVLLLPVVPLGWLCAVRASWWNKAYLGPILAAAAVLLPAHQVVGRHTIPVDRWWRTPTPLLTAENNLGLLYAHDDGVRKNRAEAAKWYLRAAEAGDANAQENLGVLYATGQSAEDQRQAVAWYRKAADDGNGEALTNLGVMYAVGHGVPRDLAAALRYFLKAAERGYAVAQNNVGMMYATGAGTAQDPREAFKWSWEAANQGNTDAQRRLAMMYANGSGVPRDLVQAYAWLSVSGALAQKPDQANLSILEQRMSAAQIAESRHRAASVLDHLATNRD